MYKQDTICKCGNNCQPYFTHRQIGELYCEYSNSGTIQKQRQYLLNLIKVNDSSTYWLKLRNGALKPVCRRMFRFAFNLTRKEIQRLNMEFIFYKGQQGDIESDAISVTSESEEENKVEPDETSKITEPGKATRRQSANAAAIIDLTENSPTEPVVATRPRPPAPAPETPRTSKPGARLRLKRGRKWTAAKRARIRGISLLARELETVATATVERTTSIRKAKLKAAAAISAAVAGTRGVATESSTVNETETAAAQSTSQQQQSRTISSLLSPASAQGRFMLSAASTNRLRRIILNKVESALSSVVEASNDINKYDAIAQAAMEASSSFAILAGKAAESVLMAASDYNIIERTASSKKIFKTILQQLTTTQNIVKQSALSIKWLTESVSPKRLGETLVSLRQTT